MAGNYNKYFVDIDIYIDDKKLDERIKCEFVDAVYDAFHINRPKIVNFLLFKTKLRDKLLLPQVLINHIRHKPHNERIDQLVSNEMSKTLEDFFKKFEPKQIKLEDCKNNIVIRTKDRGIFGTILVLMRSIERNPAGLLAG